VEGRWYHYFIRHRATLLKALLLIQGSPQIVIISTPWYRKETHLKGKSTNVNGPTVKARSLQKPLN
jgi:hypothetical protein